MADRVPAEAPEPFRGIVSDGFEPSEVMLKLPVALPLADGANFTLKLAVCPALSVTGSANPVIEKPLPDALAAVILRLDPPALVRV